MPLRSRWIIPALIVTFVLILLFLFNGVHLQSVPKVLSSSLLIGTLILLVNLALAIDTAYRSRKVPLLIRIVPVLAATILLIGFGSVSAKALALAQGQQPVFAMPWLFFISIMLSQSGRLIQRYWEQPNKAVWLRITRAAIIGAGMLVGILCVYISLMSRQ